MGKEQSRPITRASKAQIDMGSLKAKIHLQLIRDRKNNQVIKGEKQLIQRIKAKSRNKTEELLIAERVVNGLKYAQVCNQLMAYAASIRTQANFLSENMLIPQKIAPWLPQIYSLIYAADLLGLSSLKQFKQLMRALNDPTGIKMYVNPEVIQLLTPTPTAEQLNVNNIALEEINMAGHKFTRDFKPNGGNGNQSKDSSFADLERRLAEELGNKLSVNDNSNKGGQGFGNGGSYGGNGGNGGNGGFGQVNYYDLDKNTPTPAKLQQFSNPYGIRQTYNAPKTQQKIVPSFTPIPQVPKNPQRKPAQFNDSRISINSLQDIEYFPQIVPQVPVTNAEFDRICQILRAAM